MVLPTASKASTSQSTYASVAPRCSSWILAFSPRHRLHRIAAKSGRSRILPSSSAGCVGQSLRYGTYLAYGMPIRGDRPRRLRVRVAGSAGETGEALRGPSDAVGECRAPRRAPPLRQVRCSKAFAHACITQDLPPPCRCWLRKDLVRVSAHHLWTPPSRQGEN